MDLCSCRYDLISCTIYLLYLYLCVCFQDIPPPVKQIKVEPDAESADVKDKKKKKKKKCESVALKKSQLQLDDLPPELLPKHQERIKIKVQYIRVHVYV